MCVFQLASTCAFRPRISQLTMVEYTLKDLLAPLRHSSSRIRTFRGVSRKIRVEVEFSSSLPLPFSLLPEKVVENGKEWRLENWL